MRIFLLSFSLRAVRICMVCFQQRPLCSFRGTWVSTFLGSLPRQMYRRWLCTLNRGRSLWTRCRPVNRFTAKSSWAFNPRIALDVSPADVSPCAGHTFPERVHERKQRRPTQRGVARQRDHVPVPALQRQGDQRLWSGGGERRPKPRPRGADLDGRETWRRRAEDRGGCADRALPPGAVCTVCRSLCV